MSKSKLGIKAFVAFLLAVFLYIATPTIDDLLTIPFIALLLHQPIYIIAIVYYGIAWIMVILLTFAFERIK